MVYYYGGWSTFSSRTQRRSDGTIVIQGRRFEIPNLYRHFRQVEIRYADWDLSHVHLVDERTGQPLCRVFPQDKAANANALRRSLEPVTEERCMPPAQGMPRCWLNCSTSRPRRACHQPICPRMTMTVRNQ